MKSVLIALLTIGLFSFTYQPIQAQSNDTKPVVVPVDTTLQDGFLDALGDSEDWEDMVLSDEVLQKMEEDGLTPLSFETDEELEAYIKKVEQKIAKTKDSKKKPK